MKTNKTRNSSLPTLVNERSLSRVFSQPLPKYFTSDEIKLIINESLRERNYDSFFLCLFLWQSGLRISEALSITVSDIDLIGRVLKVKTLKRKNHQRFIPLQPSFVGEIALWINYKGLTRDNKLFSFTRRTGLNYVKFACQNAGILDKRCHPHTFRHSFAVNCLLHNIPITVLQEWLGHRDIAKTLIYTKILAHDSKAFMENIKF